jgi:two-component system response regulator AtoC
MTGVTPLRSREPDPAAHPPGADESDPTEAETKILLTPGLGPVYRQIERIAQARIPVLMVGETGVGKEHLAELIHQRSGRARHPFVRINCAAISTSLFESELFGHTAGAFTGADRTKVGWLEAAGEGTVLLDEVAELSLDLQAKLLRALETGAAPRVGGLEQRPIRARFVAATNVHVEGALESGRLRRDLYFRIAGIQLGIPPLRARPDDILLLAEHFAQLHGGRLPASRRWTLAEEARAALVRHPWTGNVRELRNVLDRAVLLAEGGVIEAEHLQLGGEPRRAADPIPPDTSVVPERLRAPATRDQVVAALNACGGNQIRAAARLGIGVRTLSRRLDQLDIPRPRKRSA